MMPTLCCPTCGERPVDEFTYAHDRSIYQRVIDRHPDGHIRLSDHEEEVDIGENIRLFHDPEGGCGEYLKEIPDTITEVSR